VQLRQDQVTFLSRRRDTARGRFFLSYEKKKKRRLGMIFENFVIKMWFSWDIHFFSLNWRVVFSLDPQNGQSPGEVG
jgi:hypothetical protein